MGKLAGNISPRPRRPRAWRIAFAVAGIAILVAGCFLAVRSRPSGRGPSAPAAAASSAHAGPAPRIAEILAVNHRTILDADEDNSAWLEVEAGDGPAELAGWALSDDASNPRKWIFPDISIPAGERRIVWMSGKDRIARAPESIARRVDVPFERTYIASGEEWAYLLSTPSSEPPAGWTGIDFDDASFERGPSGFGYADGDDRTEVPEGTTCILIRRPFEVEDPRSVHHLVLQVDCDDGFIAWLNGTRVAEKNAPVGEISFSSTATRTHEAGAPERFDLTSRRDLLRAGKNVLAIAGLNLRPSSDMSLIPELGTLPIDLHASFRLSARGGTVLLADPDGAVADRLEYPRQVPDQSFGRTRAARPETGFFLTPTPGAPKPANCLPEPVEATFEFSPPPGVHPGPLDVGIGARASTSSLIARYTLDGSEPVAESAAVPAAISIGRDGAIRVAGFVGDERATPVATATYFFGSPPPLPRIAISIDPVRFRRLHLEVAARGRAAEQPAHLEVFDPTGRLLASTAFGLRLHGNVGRRGGMETSKSYRAYFRDCYGLSRLDVPIIPDSKVPYDKLVLRAGFNDAFHGTNGNRSQASLIRDQVIRDLHAAMGDLASRGTWCTVAIDGEHRGLYNAVERLDDDFLSAHLGKAAWDIIGLPLDVVRGDDAAWKELEAYLRENDLAGDSAFRGLARLVDIDAFTRYAILELWAQNHDWVTNNVIAYRRRTPPGPWRFLAWDSEFGMGLIPSGYGADSFAFLYSREWMVRDLFAALMANAGWRRAFPAEVEKLLAGPLSPENVRAVIAKHRDAIAPLLERDLGSAAAGATFDDWMGNVRALEEFADRRPAVFRRFAAKWCADAENEVPPADRPAPFAGERGELAVLAFGADGEPRQIRRGGEDGGPGAEEKIAAPPGSGAMTTVALPDGGRLAVYRGRDGAVHLLTKGGSGGAWRHEDLTRALGIPEASADPDIAVTGYDGVPHIAYRDREGWIHEIYRQGGSWKHGKVLLASRTPGRPSIYFWRELHIIYRDIDEKVGEAWLDDGPRRGLAHRYWVHVPIGRDAPPAQGDPVGTAWRGTNTQCVLYTTRGRLCSLEYGGGWRATTLSMGLRTPLAGGFFTFRDPPETSGATNFVLARDAAGHVIEARCQGRSWAVSDLNAAFGAPAAAGEPAGVAMPDGTRWVVYRAADGSLHELRHESAGDNSWTHGPLGAR